MDCSRREKRIYSRNREAILKMVREYSSMISAIIERDEVTERINRQLKNEIWMKGTRGNRDGFFERHKQKTILDIILNDLYDHSVKIGDPDDP